MNKQQLIEEAAKNETENAQLYKSAAQLAVAKGEEVTFKKQIKHEKFQK